MADWSIVATSDLSEDLRWDAEYYRSSFLKQAKAILRMPHRQLSEVATISDGNHLSIAEEFCQSGVRYLRGQDLSEFFISDADPIYIPEKHYNALARSHMLPGDVLVGIVGTIGSVGLVTERHGKLTGNCKLAIVRAKELPAEYIAAYLASRAGQNEIQRRIRGAVQMGLILPDLKEIPIPLASESVRNRIVGMVKSAQDARHRASDDVSEAEGLLASSLGLDKLARISHRRD